ncbi:hypothetical protein TNCV_1241511, partial [Trichonephila clavipes]
ESPIPRYVKGFPLGNSTPSLGEFAGSKSALLRGLKGKLYQCFGRAPPNRFSHVKFLRFRLRLNSRASQRFPLADRHSDRSGYLQFRFRASRSPYRFSLYRGRDLTRAPSNQSPSRWRSFTTAPSNPNLLSGVLATLFYLSLSNPLPHNHPSVISCSFAAPVGLGSLDLLSFCRSCRSQLP